MKKILILMGMVLFFAHSKAQTGATCATALTFDSTNINGSPQELQVQSSQWYVFNALNTKIDIAIQFVQGADKVTKAVLWGSACNSLIKITDDTISSGTDSLLMLSTTSITNGATYFLQIFKSNGTDSTYFKADLNFLFPPPLCSSCSLPVVPCDLICNGNFETYTSLPTGQDQVNRSCPWVKANLNTPDYLYVGATGGMGVPGNLFGTQSSSTFGHSGYAGIVTRNPTGYFEQFYQKMKAPMIAGKSYAVEMKVSLSDYSKHKINGLGMYFSSGDPYQAVWGSIAFVSAQTVTSGATYITNTGGWTTLTWTYVAVGGEAYATVGCFGGGIASTTPALTPPGGGGVYAYYYIDDISVKEIVTPVVTATPSTICNGSSSALASSPTGTGFVFSWSPSTGLSDPTISNPTAAPTSTTTYSVTITNANSCSGTTPVTVTVNPLPTVNAVGNITVCKDDVISASNFTSTPTGATFAWTNTNTNIGIAASGSGNVSSFTAANGTAAPITGTISVTPTLAGCVGTPLTYTITVNPKPTVTSGSIPNITVCKNGTISATSFASTTTGTTFSWTNSNATIGLAASGTGNIASFTGLNTTTAPNIATITVTPSANGCTGIPATYTITVNPLTTVNAISSFTVCRYASVAASNFTSPTTGATFSWTNSNTAIGLAASGSGNVPVFTATNTTASPISGLITVTPSYGGCPGTPSTYTITINPGPTITASASPTSIALGTSSTLSSTSSTGTYTWTPAATLSNPAISNPVATPNVTTTYTVSTTNSYGCSVSATATVTVTYAQCGLHIDNDILSNSTSSAVFGAGPVVNKNIHVAANVTLTINNSIIFSGCNFNMEAGSKIVIQAPRTLTLTDKTHLFACNDMWDGIYVPAQTSIIVQNHAFIEDATNAVVSQGGGSFTINTAIFNRNYKAVDVQTYGNIHPGTIVNTVFTSRYIPSFVSTGNVSNYTVSGVIGFPLTSFPAANMRSPNSGARSPFGVVATDVVSLNIGSASGTLNIFDYLGCGISLARTDSKIYNNQFQNMAAISTCVGCPALLARGVSAIGTATGTYSVEVGGSLTGQLNTFSNIYEAVYLQNYKTSKVLNNTITNSSTSTGTTGVGRNGIIVQPSENNSVFVQENSVNDCATGIWINRNNAASINTVDLVVNSNTVSADASGFCTNGIYVTDLLAGTTLVPTTSEIRDNVVTETINCISLSNIKKPLNVESNSVTVRYATTLARNGIKAVGCQNVSIITNHTKYNNVGGTAYTSGGNPLAYGIFLQNSSNMIVSCNLVEDAARSLVFQGTCTSPTATGFGITQNTMRRAQDGFVLFTSGVIGTQGSSTVASNNYWDMTTTPTFANSQTYTMVTDANTASVLYMNSPTTGANATMPTNNKTSLTLGTHNYLSGSGLNTSTGSPASCSLVPAFAEGGGGDELQMNGISESMDASGDHVSMLENTINEEIPDEDIRWMREKYVFDAIMDDNLSGNAVLDSFYNAEHNFAELRSIEDAIMAADYAQAGTLNTALVPVNTIESNQQVVNALIISQLLDSAYIYTTADLSALYDIALLCPVTSGYAVYQARNMLMSIEEKVIDFEDHCEEAELRLAEKLTAMKREATHSFRLYPNPNNGNMLLEYNIAESDAGFFEITDITGKKILRNELQKGENKLRVKNEQLEAGVYIYHIVINNKIVKSDKLLIIK
jgi:hypothetical protein